ncbi:MAG: type II toxin-antitoxin system RelE/ParE family toxin [Albidovulum sp.]|nr:type II toxin-antitoxin system RelE/ParE family toxin [Albidovulum sp.]MDE0306134.1 type II toxin-antitoxin system RelE/ParE family toxin [Albidovulum sp.]
MIRSFADRRTESIFHGDGAPSFPPDVLKRARSKLDRINYAVGINDLRISPGNRLEQLTGDRRGQHSIRVSRGWRICFAWRDGDAFDVELSNQSN